MAIASPGCGTAYRSVHGGVVGGAVVEEGAVVMGGVVLVGVELAVAEALAAVLDRRKLYVSLSVSGVVRHHPLEVSSDRQCPRKSVYHAPFHLLRHQCAERKVDLRDEAGVLPVLLPVWRNCERSQ